MSLGFKMSLRQLCLVSAGMAVVLPATITQAQEVPIVLPGAPGQTARRLDANEAIKIADSRYSHDDVVFMQDMIPHHNQAVEMAALVEGRTNRREIIEAAGRITASQADEISFMQQWLRDRGEVAPEPDAHNAMHTSHKMAGMATPAQLAQLAAVKGVDFDQLFLTLMIAHHKGAVEMVEHLHRQPGSAYDPVLYDFTNDVRNDQNSEIKKMGVILASLSNDPRVGLKPGFEGAGEAIKNLELVANLPKPRGFFDPQNPAGLPAKKQKDGDGEEAEKQADDGQGVENTQWGSRSPLLSFSNTDFAFSGDTMVLGNYHGFNVYKLKADELPQHISSVVCPGGQGDVSIVGDLLIMSVEQTRGRIDCGLQGIAEDVSKERFRGLRIFDISNLAQPVQVGQVQTCRGSHTHSVVSVSEDDGKIIVYNSGTAGVRDGKELEGCVGDVAGDDRTALFRIDVVEIPIDDPSKARIIDSPAVFADPETGRLAGLWQGGDHGEDTQSSEQTNQCHDITVFPTRNIAAGACSGNGIIFDITDPLNPQRLDAVVDKGFAYWHSATFNNDGTKVIFTDEWGGGSRPRCRAHDPKDWGADAIYDIVDGKLVFKGHFKMPAPQSEQENCVAHNGSVVPVPGRDIFVQAWYQGGLSVIDFTDSTNPVEIAYFDRGPVHEELTVLGGYWSTYFYDGKIYGSEIARGLDILTLVASEHLSENEIAAAALADQGKTFNPQQQFPVKWPQHPVVARAYMDQLMRGDNLSKDRFDDLASLLDQADAKLDAGAKDRGLAKRIKAIAKDLGAEHANTQNGSVVEKRFAALTETLQGIAKRLG